MKGDRCKWEKGRRAPESATAVFSNKTRVTTQVRKVTAEMVRNVSKLEVYFPGRSSETSHRIK